MRAWNKYRSFKRWSMNKGSAPNLLVWEGWDSLMEGRKALQGDLHKLDPWAGASRVRFIKNKCQNLHLGHPTPAAPGWSRGTGNALGVLGKGMDMSSGCPGG